MGKFIDLTNRVFGDLTVLKQSDYVPPAGKHGHGAYWDCLCVCGSITHVISARLRNRKATGCSACYHRVSDLIGVGANGLYAQYRNVARHKGKNRSAIPFELTPEQFLRLVSGDCFYCGFEPQQVLRYYNGEFVHNGIDRVDSNLGYIVDNCVPCCKICNYAKHNLSREEFLIWLRRAYEHNYGKHN